MNNKEYKLKLKDYENHWLCTLNYKPDDEGTYEPIKIAKTLADLIIYALTYNYIFELPQDYTYKTVYSIILTTGNFDPEFRAHSICSSDIIYSTLNKDKAEMRFKNIVKLTKKDTHNVADASNWFCWHTEDYARNQIIHSYNMRESYIIEYKGESI